MPTSSGTDRAGLLTSVHCLVRSARRPSTAGAPPGLDGAAPVRLIDGGDGLWLVVSDVPADAYDGPAIEAGLRDLDWVARHALAHEGVVEHFLRKGALIPMKLFTLYRGDARALADVAERRPGLERVFDDVRGKEEWGVRVLAAPPAPDELPRPARSAAASDTPGTDFLKRKHEARAAARTRSEDLYRAADELFRDLEALASRARRAERLPEAAGARLVLEGAFLVPTRRAAAFAAAVERGADEGRRRGLEVVLTGPWAAYHFVEGGDVSDALDLHAGPDLLGDSESSALDVIDHLLDKGCVVTGRLVLGLANVDLVQIELSLVLSGAERMAATVLDGPDEPG